MNKSVIFNRINVVAILLLLTIYACNSVPQQLSMMGNINKEKEGGDGYTVFIKIEDGDEVNQVIEELWKRNIQSLIVEGGTKTLQYFLDNNLFDEIRCLEGDVHLKKGIKAPQVSTPLTWKTISFGNDKLKIAVKP